MPISMPKPIEVERTIPIALEPCRGLCDTMIAGLASLLGRFRIHPELSPWEGNETRLEAGRALKARLELVPADVGTTIRLRVAGTVLILGRKDILRGILEKIEEMGGEP